MKKWLMFLLVFMVTLVTACASKVPATQYYLLSADSGPFKPVTNHQQSYFIEPVVLADHLNRAALVMLRADNQVQLAHYHLWAEPLASGITQVLEYELNQQCACQVSSARQGYSFQKASARKNSDEKNNDVIRLMVDQFAVNESGLVTLSGSYLVGESGMQRFYLQQTLSGNGFAQAVLVQKQLLAQLAAEMTAQTEATAIQ